jgi:sugar phosphate isomerase/epimerase
MKIGVVTKLFAELGWPLGKTLDYVRRAGCDEVELTTGGYAGDDHCRPAELLKDAAAAEGFLHAVRERGLEIGSLSIPGNPLHPDQAVAREHDRQYRDTVKLAAKLGVGVVTVWAGCPGGSAVDRRPNWVNCVWPPEALGTLEWQWEQRVIPYWLKASSFAEDHGVRLAVELMPGTVVYNAESFLHLKEVGGTIVGATLDPSHLIWQGIDTASCIREMGDSILNFHVKDTWIDPPNAALDGVLDTKPLSEARYRSWIFRTIGHGNGLGLWRRYVDELRLAGYEGALCLEQRDALMGEEEGFEEGVRLLRQVITGAETAENRPA